MGGLPDVSRETPHRPAIYSQRVTRVVNKKLISAEMSFLTRTRSFSQESGLDPESDSPAFSFLGFGAFPSVSFAWLLSFSFPAGFLFL